MKNHRLIVFIASVAAAQATFAQGTLYTYANTADAVASAGDMDLDGRPDAIVTSAGTGSSLGLVRIVSGATGATIASTNGTTAGAGYGAAIAGGIDLNGDGRPDYIVGAPVGAPLLSVLPQVRALNSTGVTIWLRSGVASTLFGSALAIGGDLNGDGVGDVLVGAPEDGATHGGAAYVLSGASGATIRQHLGSVATIGEFGRAVAFAGDINGDGVTDYAVGDPRYNMWGSGDVTVYSGATGAVLRTLSGVATDGFGCSIASVGDIDGDGRPELVIGAQNEAVATLTIGSVSLFSGATGALIRKTTAFPATQNFGLSVAALGDYDGDGVPDYAAHYPIAIASGGIPKHIGAARVISGATGADLASISSAFNGPIAAAGDVNLDSVPDLLVAGGIGTPNYSALFLGQCAPPASYCTAKTNSLGCVPFTTFTGASSASIGPDLTLVATQVQGQKNGLLFWGLAPAAIPFGGGLLCVAPPLKRTSVSNSGGSNQDCSGALAYTFTKSYLATNGLTPGSLVHTQFWMRDPGFAAPNNLGLTRGMLFTVWP